MIEAFPWTVRWSTQQWQKNGYWVQKTEAWVGFRACIQAVCLSQWWAHYDWKNKIEAWLCMYLIMIPFILSSTILAGLEIGWRFLRQEKRMEYDGLELWTNIRWCIYGRLYIYSMLSISSSFSPGADNIIIKVQKLNLFLIGPPFRYHNQLLLFFYARDEV